MKIKGSIIKSRLAFIEEHFGNGGLKRVIHSLPKNYSTVLSGLVLAMSWYPFELGCALDDAIVKILGKNDITIFEMLGEASAEKNLRGVHKNFLEKNPVDFLKKTPAIYKFYYDKGYREFIQKGPNEGIITTYESETFSVPDCLTVIGWYRKALLMCGAKDVQIKEEKCRARGDNVCSYKIAWK